MTTYASPDDLFSGDVDTEDVELSRGLVRVRGLSRQEWFVVGKAADGDGNVAETKTLAMAMVEPAMTEKQVEAWRRRPGAQLDIAKVTDAVRRLTGIEQGAAKSDVAAAGD